MAALLLAVTAGPTLAQWLASSPQEQALDEIAFSDIRRSLETGLDDVQSLFVASGGRVLFEYHRDGQPDALRDVQSVAKSALSTLVGIALTRGHLASVDQAVLDLMPEWETANMDPRARQITVRHLLTMTAGFDTRVAPTPSADPLSKRLWARPLAHTPGSSFAYDNGAVPILAAVLERAVDMPLPQYAREHLVAPLGMHEPVYGPTSARMRTQDMAKLGQLHLQEGRWNGAQLVAADYIGSATTPRNAGGPPVGLSYGYMWWSAPSQASRPTFLASGFGGQFIWVNPATELVVAGTSTVSPQSAARGQLLRLIRNEVFAAAQKRRKDGG
ncbi:serine hydrolase [Xenophilus arseniciresistens]|uniref:Serine hydrolase n=1 Tax=Xenophilus arseniciresistens TaxID=1283306 RepID=A0AAE3SZ84_9BURK|nr:serine hydrolase [Xenophilus arseniciresistens]MDA7416897.1 serine hydrolase [Xenophilus arseniciresistens]